MLPEGARVGVAVSGGADSVCLLHVLLELGARVHILHLDHGLRGEESCADARFVEELAARLQLPFTMRRAVLAPGNLEQAAREARLAFFRERIETGVVDRVAVGHTMSDQAETVLFRFLRGAGTAGLAGIRPVTSGGIVRPLLEVDRAAVEDYLRSRGISWRLDSTNITRRFARNRIRLDLLPQLAREWNPSIVETLARTAEVAQAEEEWWVAETARFPLTRKDGAILAEADTLAAIPLALGRRVVRRAIAEAKGNLRQIELQHVDQVLTLAARDAGHGQARLPGVVVTRSQNWVRFGEFTSPEYRIPVTVPGVFPVPGADFALSLELIEKSETSDLSQYVYNIEMGCLDWPRLSGSLLLRNWLPGDRYQPWSGAESQKLKTLFQKAKIPLWERRGWPVLVDESGIVWTHRFGPAAALAADYSSDTILTIKEVGIGSRGAASKEE